MISAHNLLACVVASVVLVLIPGPTVVFVVSRALTHGRRAALCSVAGNSTGLVVVVGLVAFGMGTVVEKSVVAFTVVKLVGAGYLIYLGVRVFHERGGLAALMTSEVPVGSAHRVYRQGVLVGLTNPKSLVFFAAMLPQFVDAKAGHVPLQMLVLGLVFVAVAMVLDSVWGLAAGTARTWFARSPRRLGMLGGTGGLMMIGLGLGLAVSGRKD